MNRTGVIAAMLILTCAGMVLAGVGRSAAAAENPPAPIAADGNGSLPAAYVIGCGDILEISVWKEPDLAKRTIVLPDGHISFPLIGLVRAEGLTLDQLKNEIEQKIRRYVPHPNLTVAVHQINSLYIYIVGKVHNAGRFELNANVDVLQALAMAGGLNPFAKKSKIKIFRKNSDHTTIFDFNYDQVAEGKYLDQNIVLQRGDVIVVP